MKRLNVRLLAAAMFLSLFAAGQNSFTVVHQLLQANCSGAGCHNGSTATFNVNQPEASVYSSLVNITPLNPTAAGKGNKLVAPGDPGRSFLLRKMSHGVSSGLAITQPAEGNYMPYNANPLDDKDFEYIRQWILYGAPQTGNVVDTALVNAYYRDGGIDGTYAQHDPPPAGQGQQIYLGKVFVPPATESEFFIKYDMQFANNTEIPKIVSLMPPQTHHFVMYKFMPGTATQYSPGLRDLSQDSHSDTRNPIATGPGLWDYDLPAGTAYFWEAGTFIDLNLHIKNTNQDSILGVDLYINVYTQPQGTAQNYMNVLLFPNLDITIPQDGQEHTFTVEELDPFATNKWKVWNIYTHTHKYGTDYDVYMRNPNGTKGNQIYEGMYSYEQGFMVGYYRWGPEVTFEYFPDQALLEIDPRDGIIHEAKFRNTAGPDPVYWGLTSDDEMMVVGIQYVNGDALTDLPSTNAATKHPIHLFPNPGKGTLSINYTLDKAEDLVIDVINTVGAKVKNLFAGSQSGGVHTQTFDTESLAPGIYFIQTTISGKAVTQKLVVTE
jgi:hypothetical protein